jgi:hypothetical protein
MPYPHYTAIANPQVAVPVSGVVDPDDATAVVRKFSKSPHRTSRLADLIGGAVAGDSGRVLVVGSSGHNRQADTVLAHRNSPTSYSGGGRAAWTKYSEPYIPGHSNDDNLGRVRTYHRTTEA